MARKAAAEIEETNQPAAASEQPAGLIEMQKDGQTIRVCAAQVEQHQRLGWVLAE
jgi:hypothetical protein